MGLPPHLEEAYGLLQVEPTEDLQTVKAAYRKLALIHHPDKNKEGDGEKFKAISGAYEAICMHVKGRDEVDFDDPDFQILFELFHLFDFIGSQQQHTADASGAYASGGSSCEGDDDDLEDENDFDGSASEIDDDRDYTDGEDDEDTEEQEKSSEWEPETPANEQGRGALDFEGHVCHGDHSACHHNVGVPFPRQAKWSLPSEAIRSDNLQLLQKHELLTKLAGGKKRVETDRERKVRVKLLLIEQELARERREAEAKQKKEAARLAREQEKQEAAARRAEKNAKKRAAVQEKATLSKKLIQEKLLTAQKDRSAVFDQLIACAKVHNDEEYYKACEFVKQLICEKDVKVTGWEKLPELPLENVPAVEMQETTLMHLAVQASDSELVSWLCEKGTSLFAIIRQAFVAETLFAGARADEVDAAGYAPLHRALENGDKKMLDYFFEAFPPYNSEGEEIPANMRVYDPTKPDDPAMSLVMLATLSGDAEVVDYVLDRSTVEEVEHAYRYAQLQIRQARFHKPTIAAWRSVQQMLQQKDGFSIPLEFAARSHTRPHFTSRGGKTWHKNGHQIRNHHEGRMQAAVAAKSARANTSAA